MTNEITHKLKKKIYKNQNKSLQNFINDLGGLASCLNTTSYE